MKNLIFIFLIPLTGFAQTVELNIPPNLIGARFDLVAYQGLYENVLDSATADSSLLILNAAVLEDGMAKLNLNGNKLTDLIILKNEKLTGTITINNSELKTDWTDSKENDAFDLLLDLSGQYSDAVERLSGLMDNIPEFHPQREAINDSLQSSYRTILGAYNASLQKLRASYPNTYAADILVGLDALPRREDRQEWKEEFDNDPAFLHRHFFANVDFSDARTATNPYLKNKVLEYIYTYIVKDEQGLKDGIDLIMTKADRNTEVKKACAEILIGFFTDQGITEYVDHLNQEHLSGCDISFTGDIGKIIARSSPYRVDDEVENVTISDRNESQQDITVSGSQFNVLMFYASWCGHCQEEIPMLPSLLDQYNGKMELKAISIDTLNDDWFSVLDLFPATTQHYCDLKGWDSPAAEQFGISATPSFILLDENRKYLGRASSLVSLGVLLGEQ